MTSKGVNDARTASVAMVLLAVLILHANTGARADPDEDAAPMLTFSECQEGPGRCSQDAGSGQDSPAPVSNATDSGQCPAGFYGDNCTAVCSVNCVNGTCGRDTGNCTFGCIVGFAGANCTQGCPRGFFGDQCLQTCPENCHDDKCDSRTGVCSAGCKGDYWGTDCTLGVEMGRNTRRDRLKFYQNLSAEGKSVLLYLLASRYEHALARAQLEVEQALQDRNDIRHFLSSPGQAPT